MGLSCGHRIPDDNHGYERAIAMHDLVDVAASHGATVEQTWRNMVEAMRDVLAGRLKSEVWTPERWSLGDCSCKCPDLHHIDLPATDHLHQETKRRTGLCVRRRRRPRLGKIATGHESIAPDEEA